MIGTGLAYTPEQFWDLTLGQRTAAADAAREQAKGSK